MSHRNPIIELSFNWQLKGTIAPGGTVLKVAVDDKERLWLASPAGLFCRDGEGWRAVPRGVTFWRLNTVTVHGRSLWVSGMPGGIIRSANGGQSWHRCWIEQTEAPVVAIATSPNFARDRVLLAATDGDGILRSTDGGRHWELSNFGLREFAVLDVVMAPEIGRYEYAFAITEHSFYQSPNGGRAWRRMDMGVADCQPIALAISPHFTEDRTVCVGTEAGQLFISTDAGHTWDLTSHAFDTINALAFTTDNALLVGTAFGGYHIENWKSPHLSPISNPSAPLRKSLQSPILSLANLNGSLYAGLVDGLSVSADDGRSWQPVTGLSARRFVWYRPQTAAWWLAAGPEEGVWQTIDGGRQWQCIWEKTPVLALAATENKIWVSTLDGLVTSTDRGTSWQVVWQPEAPITALMAAKGMVWAGDAAGQIWRQAGHEWEQVNVPFAGQQLVGFVIPDDLVLAVVWSAENRMLQLWRSQDGGSDWQPWFSQAAGAVLPHVAIGREGAVVGLGSFIYRQTETGWQRQRVTNQAAPVTAVCAVDAGFLTAITDQLLHSDDGVTWKPLLNGLSGQPVVFLSAVANELVAGTAAGHIWSGQFA